MRLLRSLPAAAALAVLAWTLLPIPEAEARRRCIPTLFNCNCTFAQPCPTGDALKALQTSLAVAQEQLLLEAMGVLQPGIDALQAAVPPEAVSLLQRIPAQQLLNATLRGTNPANMLGAVAPLAGLAFGASPIADLGLQLPGLQGPQGQDLVVRSLSEQMLGGRMTPNLPGPQGQDVVARIMSEQMLGGRMTPNLPGPQGQDVVARIMSEQMLGGRMTPNLPGPQGQDVVARIMSEQMLGGRMTPNLPGPQGQDVVVRLLSQQMQTGHTGAGGQVIAGLPGMAQLAVPALGLVGAADALGGMQVVQQGLQVAQGLGALSQQAMALRGASMQQVFMSLPALGAPSYASPGIATHASAWLPVGAQAPSGGDFAAVRQAVVAAYESGGSPVEIRRRADAAVVSVASDAQAKALQIRHALRRHAEIVPRLEATVQAARTVGDDWRANAAVQMALSAIDDEIREAEAMLLALRSSSLAARGVGQRGLQATTAGGVGGSGRTAADSVAGGRTDRDAYVDTIVRLESRPGDPGFAHPNSTAVGDGQFLRGTWLDYVRANPERFAGLSPEEALARRADPMESRRAISWYADRNGQTLARAGLPVNNTTLGLAHRFGASGATSILRADPSTPIEQALPNGRAVLAANPDLRGRTVGDVVGRTSRAFGGA